MCSTEICRINMTDGLCGQKSFFLKALAHFWRLNASPAFILSAKAHQLKIKVLNTVTSHPQLTTAKKNGATKLSQQSCSTISIINSSQR